jgi:hypothetical protein
LRGRRGRGWGQWGEMNQSLYAHMNNKRKMKKKRSWLVVLGSLKIEGLVSGVDFCVISHDKRTKRARD